MTLIHAKTALLPDGWADDVLVTVEGGRIAAVAQGEKPQGQRVDCLLPAMVNLHSHAFQRAMAGMTEYRSAGQDSFWTWRTLMYRFLDRLGPEDVQAIAAMVMLEMAEAGYAAVAEFHYLHHAPGGGVYGDLAEMSGRIAARRLSGISFLEPVVAGAAAGGEAGGHRLSGRRDAAADCRCPRTRKAWRRCDKQPVAVDERRSAPLLPHGAKA